MVPKWVWWLSPVEKATLPKQLCLSQRVETRESKRIEEIQSGSSWDLCWRGWERWGGGVGGKSPGSIRAAPREKVPNGLSQCHTKRRYYTDFSEFDSADIIDPMRWVSRLLSNNNEYWWAMHIPRERNAWLIGIHSYYTISANPIYMDPDYNSPLSYCWGYRNLSINLYSGLFELAF